MKTPIGQFELFLFFLCLSVFLLLVIPANYAVVVSIDTGIPCRLRISIKECFVVCQTHSYHCVELGILLPFVA